LKVLIIDDERDIRDLASVSLARSEDMQVITASSGPEGVRLAREQHPDAILLDLMMPAMDGRATLQALRGEDGHREDPGRADERGLRRRAGAGAAGRGGRDPQAVRPHHAAGAPALRAGGHALTMQSWDDAYSHLRASFVHEAAARLDQITGLLDALSANPADSTSFLELRRRFHAFAGAGTSYGFPDVTALGLRGERECAALIRQGGGPGAQDLERWRGIVKDMREVFASAREVRPEAPREATAPARHGPESILIVDEDEQVRESLTHLLETEGMKTRAVRTKAEAVLALDEAVPNGVITDIRLPDGSGYDLVEHIRGLPLAAAESLPILILSPLSPFLDKVEAIHCGADGYFEKPVDWEALMRRLQHLLERNRPESARILSVEDDPHQSAFVSAVLKSAGYDVHVCDEPTRFEADLVAFKPDLVLMDIMLPGITGYDLVRYLRQDERHAALPVIFLTTDGQLQARIETAKVGGDDHLLKPVPPPLLLSAVAARLERSRFLKSLLDRDGLTRLLTHTAFLERARAAPGPEAAPPEQAQRVGDDRPRPLQGRQRQVRPPGGRPRAGRPGRAPSPAPAPGRHHRPLRRRGVRGPDRGPAGGGHHAPHLRLLEEFAALEHEVAGGGSFHCTFSAGVAMIEPGMDLDSWKKAADDALYAAKAAGRKRVIAASASRTKPAVVPHSPIATA
jgi:DNA-binding response OmpR family regulator